MRKVVQGVLVCAAVIPIAPAVPAGLTGGKVIASAAATRTARPPVVVALRGNIYVVGAGSARRLTASGKNSGPAVSPDGRLIAFLSTAHSRAGAFGRPAPDVYLVPVAGRDDGSSAYKLTPGAAPALRERLSWSPDGRYLAYYKTVEKGKSIAVSVVVCAVQGSCGEALQVGVGYGNSIAWAPDGRRFAVTVPDKRLDVVRVAVVTVGGADLAHSASTAAIVRFPGGALGARQTGNQTFPASMGGGNLSWIAGEHLLFDTIRSGEGGTMTGVWQAPASGGVAHQIIGSATDVRAGNDTDGPLAGAYGFALSPDRARLAVATRKGFYLVRVDGTRGQLLAFSASQRRGLGGLAWLGDDSGIVYVMVRQGSSPGSCGSTLFVRELGSAGPSALLDAKDSILSVANNAGFEGQCGGGGS
jgi:hypothetical protein